MLVSLNSDICEHISWFRFWIWNTFIAFVSEYDSSQCLFLHNKKKRKKIWICVRMLAQTLRSASKSLINCKLCTKLYLVKFFLRKCWCFVGNYVLKQSKLWEYWPLSRETNISSNPDCMKHTEHFTFYDYSSLRVHPLINTHRHKALNLESSCS